MAETDTSDVVQRSRQALDGITPGPWEYDDHDEDELTVRAGTAITSPGAYTSTDLIYERDVSTDWIDEYTKSDDYHQIERDARFIAAAPNIVRELADEVETLRSDLADERVTNLQFQRAASETLGLASPEVWPDTLEEDLRKLIAERDELRAEVGAIRSRLAFAERRAGYDLTPEARKLMDQAIPSWANARGVVERCLADVRAAHEELDVLRAEVERIKAGVVDEMVARILAVDSAVVEKLQTDRDEQRATIERVRGVLAKPRACEHHRVVRIEDVERALDGRTR